MRKFLPIIIGLLSLSQLFAQTKSEINTITSASNKELNSFLKTKIENESVLKDRRISIFLAENPTYKMSGYSIIKNNGLPIIKTANTNNYIDFRFSLGVS